jgi:hypothetical protein
MRCYVGMCLNLLTLLILSKNWGIFSFESTFNVFHSFGIIVHQSTRFVIEGKMPILMLDGIETFLNIKKLSIANITVGLICFVFQASNIYVD